MTEKKTRAPKKTEPKKVKVLLGPEQDAQASSNNPNTVVENMRKSMHSDEYLAKLAQQQKDILLKSVIPVTIRKDKVKKTDKSKIVFSTREWSTNFENVEMKSWRRLSDTELKDLSQVDPYISAIISTRCSQAAVIGRPSDSKFDKGTRIMELEPLSRDDFETDEQFETAQDQRQKQMKYLLNWVLNCGTKDKDIINASYVGADAFFKKCALHEFISAQVRNLLTFGRCASQIFRDDQDGVIQFFRPAPVETIYNVAQGEDITIAASDNTEYQSLLDAAEYDKLASEERPPAFVQRIDGRIVNFFTDNDMSVWFFQKQALFDLSGYPLAPIEQAIYMVYTHQQTLNYLRNHFVKGLGSKGILSIESTDPSAQLGDEDLESLRREFHNFVSRNDNSAATPVISGPMKINYIPLSPNPRDMEFLQLEEHIIRSLCSAMQISLAEAGYPHLANSGSSLSQSNKQQELTAGEERGLRMLLDTIYDGLNDILYENFPDLEDKFRITYTGVGEDTKDAVVQRHVAELQTTATMASLWADSERTDPVVAGGDVPLAPMFHQNVVRYMKYGQFMETFFGYEGWGDKPEYDFIIDPNLNSTYQQLKVSPVEQQQEAQQLQLQSQEMQLQGMEQQQQQAEQQAQMGQAVQQDGAQEPQPEQAPPQDGGNAEQVEPEQKSVRQAYDEKKKLEKSMSYYFKEWMNANE